MEEREMRVTDMENRENRENKENRVDEEILAVLSAAVAALSAGTGSRLVVRNIRRLSQTAPVWNAAGRMERMRNDMNSVR